PPLYRDISTSKNCDFSIGEGHILQAIEMSALPRRLFRLFYQGEIRSRPLPWVISRPFRGARHGDFRRNPGTPSAVRVRICENKAYWSNRFLPGRSYLTSFCGDFQALRPGPESFSSH